MQLQQTLHSIKIRKNTHSRTSESMLYSTIDILYPCPCRASSVTSFLSCSCDVERGSQMSATSSPVQHGSSWFSPPRPFSHFCPTITCITGCSLILHSEGRWLSTSRNPLAVRASQASTWQRRAVRTETYQGILSDRHMQLCRNVRVCRVHLEQKIVVITSPFGKAEKVLVACLLA